MKPHPLCQSCAVPLFIGNRGTNRDKSLSVEYCSSCYENGEFRNHSLTLHQMEIKLMEMAKVHNEISLEEAQEIIKKLPDLKRWHMSNL